MEFQSSLDSPISLDSNSSDAVNGQSSIRFDYRAAATTAPQLNMNPQNFNSSESRARAVQSHSDEVDQLVQKDKATIARECNFDLDGKTTDQRRKANNIRMSCRSFAITCWTEVAKEEILNNILEEFGETVVQYACVASEIGPTSSKKHLHMQIILKRVVNKKSWFMDKYTGVKCNYQVTKDNKAWRHYIQKDGNFVEYGSFENATSPSQSNNNLPESTNNSSTPIMNNNTSNTLQPSATAKRSTVRAQADEQRKKRDEIAAQAFLIAETDIDEAMTFAQNNLKFHFLQHSDNYLKTFTYINTRALQRRALVQVQEYVWDLSFTDCTPELRAVVTEWIKLHFRNPHRPKCLILIGPTGTGKTSFASSLPGPMCYFKGRWTLSTWRKDARYIVIDDVPWDEFESSGYPRKKDFLTANGRVGTTDKYCKSKSIEINVPAIVLLNLADAGSLLREPQSKEEIDDHQYWRERAVIYQMGPDEYFVRRGNPLPARTATETNIQHVRPLLGTDTEFEDMQRRFLEAQRQTTTTTDAAAQ